LAKGTTATVMSGSVTKLGELTFSHLSPTLLNGTVVSSGFNNGDLTDPYNTGWALFQVGSLTTMNPPALSVKFSHIGGDGIGITLGYETTMGLLKVCKVAGPGVAVGTPYNFTAGSSTFTVPAGPAPGGTCVVGPSLPLGSTVTVAETVPAGDMVSSIAVAPPGQLVGVPNLGGGSVDVTIGSGVTEVTFTDRKPTGFLEICKKGPVKGNFEFWVNGGVGPFIVPAGACSPAIELPPGPAVIYENLLFWNPLFPSPIACSTFPPAQQGPCIANFHVSIVTVSPGDISTMTTAFITNSISVPTDKK